MTALDDGERVNAPTEARNPRTAAIDTLPTLDVLRLLNREDRTVADAVEQVLPELSRAIEGALERWRMGGRIHYFGAGTSGRIALMDAAELPPTFGVPPDRVVAHHAGGAAAVELPHESAEDSEELGTADADDVSATDVAVGLTASGRTPYIAGALTVARGRGALTVLITANPDAPLAGLADVHVGVATGAEALAGSTRLKAGTAQKLVLNAFSTALMVRLGNTYSNLMVGVVASNSKLRGRVLTVLEEATGADEARCAEVLSAAGGDTKTALVCLLGGVDVAMASAALDGSGGVVRGALQILSGTDRRGPA